MMTDGFLAAGVVLEVPDEASHPVPTIRRRLHGIQTKKEETRKEARPGSHRFFTKARR
jgi:hypothetical protein